MHSGGYDATVTAEVFLLELDIWIRFQRRRKQEKHAAAEDANGQSPETEANTAAEVENETEDAKDTKNTVENAADEGNVESLEAGAENGQIEGKQKVEDTSSTQALWVDSRCYSTIRGTIIGSNRFLGKCVIMYCTYLDK